MTDGHSDGITQDVKCDKCGSPMKVFKCFRGDIYNCTKKGCKGYAHQELGVDSKIIYS